MVPLVVRREYQTPPKAIVGLVIPKGRHKCPRRPLDRLAHGPAKLAATVLGRRLRRHKETKASAFQLVGERRRANRLRTVGATFLALGRVAVGGPRPLRP